MSTLETESDQLGETLRLARFCAELTYDDLDDDVVLAVKKAIVDALASGYAGIDTEAGRPMRSYVAGLGAAGSATTLGSETAALPHFAALANGKVIWHSVTRPVERVEPAETPLPVSCRRP